MQACSKDSLSEIPKPIIAGFLRYPLYLKILNLFIIKPFLPVIDDDETMYINPLELLSICLILSSEVFGVIRGINDRFSLSKIGLNSFLKSSNGRSGKIRPSKSHLRYSL